MSGIYKNLASFCLLAFVMSSMATVQAVRYAGDSKDAPRIENLLKVLTVQKHELEKLMSMLSRLDEWKSRLDKENTRLFEEGELAKSDRKKFENGVLSEHDLNTKWHISGRSLRHDQALKAFQEEVIGFNDFVKEFNRFTKKMSHVLEKRTPVQIKALINDMQKLMSHMREAMDKGNIEKALFIARQSPIAKEFGYRQQ